MSAYSDYLTSLSLSGWWRLGESSGTTAVNAGTLGATGDGTIVNAPTLGATGPISGDADTAITFAAASSQRIQVTHNAAFAGTTMTFGCWFKRNGNPAASEVLIRKSDTGAFNYVAFLRSDGAFCTQCSSGGAAQVRGAPAGGVVPVASCDNAWHLGVGVIAPNRVINYFDGVQVSALIFSGNPDTGTGNLHFASTGAANYLSGSMDEVFIHVGELDARTIWNMYTLGATAGRRPHPRLDAPTRNRRFKFGFGK